MSNDPEPNWEVYWAVLGALDVWGEEHVAQADDARQIQRLHQIIGLAEKHDLSEMSRKVWKSVQATQLCTSKQARSIAIGCAKSLSVGDK